MLTNIKKLKWLLLILITLFASQAFGHGMSDAEKQTIIEGGNFHYVWIGATHMLSGYDHLAFVFGIIFFLTSFKDIVKYITTFTVGHSITLIFATFNAIQVNYFLVDAVIALSVCYIAFHNLDGFKKYFNMQAPNMLVMIFALGLIHGLGLSTRLQQLPLSIDNLLMNIISFNIGIELGQIAALAIMIIFINAFRRKDTFVVFSKVANSFLVFAGGYLLLMQMHGYEHSVNESEFKTDEKVVQKEKNWKDSINLTIAANDEIEYKFQIAKNAILEYEWKTQNGKLYYDFHGEPKGDTTGYYKTFRIDTNEQSRGTLVTVFEGTHGWYWKNNNAFPVNITLNVNGQYERLDLNKIETKWKDKITVSIPAKEEIEYKLLNAKGDTFEYSWETDKGELFFDFHGEPKGDTTGYFKSFKESTNKKSSGILTTIFEGTHGWYWKNDNSFPVNITLNVKGSYEIIN